MITPNGQDESKKEAQPAEENDAKERKTNKTNTKILQVMGVEWYFRLEYKKK